METLAKRIKWVLSSGRVRSARSWCVQANVSPKLVSTYLDRVKKHPSAELAASSIRQLAFAAGVRPDWLGAGLQPRDIELPNRDEAVRQLIAEGVPRTHLAPLLGYKGDLDRGVAWWRSKAAPSNEDPELVGMGAETIGYVRPAGAGTSTVAPVIAASLAAVYAILSGIEALRQTRQVPVELVDKLNFSALEALGGLLKGQRGDG